MLTFARYIEAPRRLRAFVRAHESSLIVLTALVGTIGGLVVNAMSAAVEVLHVLLFNLEMADRLSSRFRIEPWRALLVPGLGGLHPGMNIQEAIAVFDAAEAESLAVINSDGERQPIGVLSEAHATRRYAEKSEQRRREVIGET
jgi:hypothetical protein